MNERWLPPVGDTLLERYRLDECIGNGPTGSVFQATDLVSRQRVVVKTIHPSLFSERDREINTRRLIRAKALNSRRIARILDLYLEPKDGGAPFFVTEFVEGTNLRDFQQLRRNAGNAVKNPEIRYIADGVIDALSDIQHGAGHANIKPENIFLTASGVVLTDAYFLAGRTRLKWLPGELPLRDHYLADEQLMRTSEETTLSDIYSVGMVVGELLCGEAVRARIPISDQGAETGENGDRIFTKATQNAPLDRHMNLSVFKNEIAQFLPDSVREITVEDSDTQVVEADAVLSPRQLAEIAAFNRARQTEKRKTSAIPTKTEDLPFSLEPKSTGPSLADEDELDQTIVEDPELVQEMMRRASGVHNTEIPGVPEDATYQIPEKPMPPAERRGAGPRDTGISLTPPPSPASRASKTSRNAARIEESMPLDPPFTVDRRAPEHKDDVVPTVPPLVLEEEEALILDDDMVLPAGDIDEAVPIAEPLQETRPSRAASSSLKRVKPGTSQTLRRQNTQAEKKPVNTAAPKESPDNKMAYVLLAAMAIAVLVTAVIVAGDDTDAPLEAQQERLAANEAPIEKPKMLEEEPENAEENLKEEGTATADVDAPEEEAEEEEAEGDKAEEAADEETIVAAETEEEEEPEEEKAPPVEEEKKPKVEKKELTPEQKAAAQERAEERKRKREERAEERRQKREEAREAKRLAAEERKQKRKEEKAAKKAAAEQKKQSQKEAKTDTKEAKQQMAKAAAAAAPVKANPDEERSCPRGMKRITSKKTKQIGSRKVVIKSAFCIDYYEYPGKGAYPKTNVSWFDATAKCGAKGKRLCSNKEWRQACGAGKKYPYGNEWNASKCNTMSKSGKEGKVTKTGKKRKCKSPYGLLDMSGNVSEWTANKSANGGNAVQDGDTASCYRSASRSPGSKSPNVGFRCCADPE